MRHRAAPSIHSLNRHLAISIYSTSKWSLKHYQKKKEKHFEFFGNFLLILTTYYTVLKFQKLYFMFVSLYTCCATSQYVRGMSVGGVQRFFFFLFSFKSPDLSVFVLNMAFRRLSLPICIFIFFPFFSPIKATKVQQWGEKRVFLCVRTKLVK